MRIAPLRRSPGRMERIPEQHECINGKARIRCHDVGRYTPSHGLAADNEEVSGGIELTSHRVYHRAITRFKQRPAIRQPPSLLAVQEVEGDDIEAGSTEGAREVDDERTALA